MNLSQLLQKLNKKSNESFLAVNFGCRVNAAETNQLSQVLIDNGFSPSTTHPPSIILINTCAITQKGEYESLARIRVLRDQYPNSAIIATGCADLSKIKSLPNVYVFTKNDTSVFYTPKIRDKFTHDQKYLLKIQSGCNHFCSYCIVPQRRSKLYSLPIDKGISTTIDAINNGYKHLIITGVNLDLYKPGLSNLLEALLTKTAIEKISFGSIPLNCIDDKFLSLIKNYKLRIENFLHIPIQSGSNRILKLMNRPYDRQKIITVFNSLKGFIFGTDVIVGFPTESDSDFQETYDLCQQIGFSKIHTFRFSPRPSTAAEILFKNYPKLSQKTINSRSRNIRNLVI